VFFENINSAAGDFPFFSSNTDGLNYRSHFHREIEVVAVMEGSVDVVCENRFFRANRGDLCLFMPGEIHSFSSPEANHLCIIKIDDTHPVEKIDFSAFRMEPNPLGRDTPLHRKLWPLVHALYEEMMVPKTGYGYMASSISNAMVCELLRSDCLKHIARDEKKRQLSAAALLEAVSDYISQHYAEPITLSDAAVHCSLSKYYFAHFFKTITGSTFCEYLTAFRLEKALPLLRFTEKKMSVVAADCGFSNMRAFDRAFRKMLGCSPSEYRRGIPENPPAHNTNT